MHYENHAVLSDILNLLPIYIYILFRIGSDRMDIERINLVIRQPLEFSDGKGLAHGPAVKIIRV